MTSIASDRIVLDAVHPPSRTLTCRTALLLATVAAVAGCSLTAQAQSTDEARRKLESSRQVLEEAKKRESGLQKDVASLEAERARVNRNLIDTAKAIQRAEAKLTQIENRSGELEAQETLVRGSLAQNHGKIAKLLGAMQRMGRNPPPVMVTRREDALEMVRSAMLLASVFPEMREQALFLSEKLNELARVMAESRKEGEQLRAETARLTDARARLDALMTQKRETIVERQGELKQVRQAAADLARSVTDLNELITRMDKTVSEQAGIAEYDKELAAGRGRTAVAAAPALPPAANNPAAEPPATTAPSAPAAGSDSAPPPAALPSSPAGRVIEARPKAGARMAGDPTAADKSTSDKPAQAAPEKPAERVAMLAPKPMKPTVPFDQMKGSLAWPASGRRVVGYGERTEVGATSKGIVIETRANAQITSPSDGWVVYAGEFRSYGQLLIINGGGGYHVVLAGLTRIDVAVGQFVLAGEPIGAMGTSGPGPEGKAVGRPPPGKSPTGKSQDALPVLYIEFRKDGRPFDSSPWWAPEGSRKTQG